MEKALELVGNGQAFEALAQKIGDYALSLRSEIESRARELAPAH